MHGAPARGAHLLLFILITTGTPVRACVCPGQYPRCDRSDGWCYNADDDYCGILHTVTSCFTFCGAKGGSTCTDSFLAPDVPTWSHVRILLTHWNDEAANVLEHLAWAAYEPSEKLVTWQCGRRPTGAHAQGRAIRFDRLLIPRHALVECRQRPHGPRLRSSPHRLPAIL
eukprot:4129839-Pleurochrysis_carterae.AAC.1